MAVTVDALADPPIGVGTGSLSGEAGVDAVRAALAAGYRHIDTARAYDSEPAVGEALARSSVDREAVVLATKVHSSMLAPDDVRESVRMSLSALNVETVDLCYVHWPAHAYDPEATLGAFAALREAGLIQRIGLCNVTVDLLQEAIRASDAPIAAVQVEYHPLWRQPELCELAREAGATVVGYSPLAGGRALELPEVRTVADRRDATPAQACLAWLLAEGVVPIPQATGTHLKENLAARSIDLTDDDIALIDAIDCRERLTDYPFAPWND
jgi:2,5-diketo-D-gluconate reductase B